MVPGNLPIGKPYTICVFNRVWHVHQARSLHQSVSSLFLENVPVANLHPHIDATPQTAALKLHLQSLPRVVRATRAAPLPDYGPQGQGLPERSSVSQFSCTAFIPILPSVYIFAYISPQPFCPCPVHRALHFFFRSGILSPPGLHRAALSHHYELIPRSVSNAVVTY